MIFLVRFQVGEFTGRHDCDLPVVSPGAFPVGKVRKAVGLVWWVLCRRCVCGFRLCPWSCCGRLLWLVVAVVVWLRLCVLVCGGALRLASFRLSSLRISSPLISSPATVVTFAANYIRSIRLLTRITYAACTGRHQRSSSNVFGKQTGNTT